MELDPALLRVLHDVEARRQPDDRPVLQLDHRHAEVRCPDRERLAGCRHAIRHQHGPEGGHAARGAEHRGEDRQRIDADIGERPDPVERLRPRMPALDPAPVDLGVGDADGADCAGSDEAPRLLLRIAHEGDRRAREPHAAGVGELDEGAGLPVARGERLLAVHVLAGLQRRGRHLRVDAVGREVHDGVDGAVCEHVGERRVLDSPESLHELGAQRAIDVGRAGDLDRGVGPDRLAVRAGDVAAADHCDAERAVSHHSPPVARSRYAWSASRIRTHSLVGSRSYGSCSTESAPS